MRATGAWDKNARNIFVERLDQCFRESGHLQKEIAELCGLSVSTMSQYRSGYAMPGIEKTVAIANAFGVDASWLLGLDILKEEFVRRSWDERQQ